MIEVRDSVGTGHEGHVLAGRARRSSSASSPAPSRRARPCRSSRRPARAPRRAAAARRDRHGALAAHVARGRRSATRAPSSSRAGCWSTSCGCCPTTRSRSSTGREEGSRAIDLRHGELPAAHLHRGGLSAPPDVDDGAAASRSTATALLETVARVGRAASRDESRPVLTGILVRFEAEQARHGRDRLVPPGRQGDGARGRRRPSSRRSCRRARSRELGRVAQSRRRARARRAREPGRLRADGVWLTTRRIDGQFPNYKQLLPEAFEHELRAAARGAARRRAARRA